MLGFFVGTFFQKSFCEFQSGCWDWLQILIGCSILLVPAFFLSIFMFWMGDDVYQKWSRFTLLWIPFSIILFLLASGSSGGFVFPTDHQILILYLPIIFSVISISIIAMTVLLRKKK